MGLPCTVMDDGCGLPFLLPAFLDLDPNLPGPLPLPFIGHSPFQCPGWPQMKQRPFFPPFGRKPFRLAVPFRPPLNLPLPLPPFLLPPFPFPFEKKIGSQ